MVSEGERDDLVIRRAEPAERDSIIALCRASLGWREGEPNEEFFAWKHDANPFGVSPAWLAVAPDGTLAGLRVLMRWGFDSPSGAISAVRAVDTATHPDYQGRGIFTRLTLGALEELADDGLGVVFNTPNDQSRPGYLKMGWSQVGRVPVAVRLRSAASALAMRGARAAASKWSRDVDVALRASDVFADTEAVELLLTLSARAGGPTRIETHRSVDYLAWRYSFEPLHYRVMPIGDSIDDGLVVFRVRDRGTATELTVCEVLAPQGAQVAPVFGYLLRATGADYAIIGAPQRASGALSTLIGSEASRWGFAPVPQLGPILTWRPVTRPDIPEMSELSMSLGDIELF